MIQEARLKLCTQPRGTISCLCNRLQQAWSVSGLLRCFWFIKRRRLRRIWIDRFRKISPRAACLPHPNVTSLLQEGQAHQRLNSAGIENHPWCRSLNDPNVASPFGMLLWHKLHWLYRGAKYIMEECKVQMVWGRSPLPYLTYNSWHITVLTPVARWKGKEWGRP